ncbi:MAG: ComF family protein [Bacteroidales bacterium]|nr:ComF family protein [Bacteroidales bacterium]
MDRAVTGAGLKDFATALSDLVLPRHCYVCGSRLTLAERHLCLGCRSDLPYTHFWERTHQPMADKYNAAIRDQVPDGVEEPYGHAAALFYYNSESGYKNIPQALKYRSALGLGREFADQLGARLASSADFADVDCVIPVPLHWRRHWGRGYNQAAVIAQRVAAALGAAFRPKALRRLRYTPSQTKVAMEKKASNVSGVFRMVDRIEARHILLVDDTFTTGATLAACHRALRSACPPSVRISVATLSYVGP